MAQKSVKFSITAQNKTAKTFAAINSSVISLNKRIVGLGVSIAGAAGLTGFGLMAIMIGADREFVTREQAAERARRRSPSPRQSEGGTLHGRFRI